MHDVDQNSYSEQFQSFTWRETAYRVPYYKFTTVLLFVLKMASMLFFQDYKTTKIILQSMLLQDMEIDNVRKRTFRNLNCTSIYQDIFVFKIQLRIYDYVSPLGLFRIAHVYLSNCNFDTVVMDERILSRILPLPSLGPPLDLQWFYFSIPILYLPSLHH